MLIHMPVCRRSQRGKQSKKCVIAGLFQGISANQHSLASHLTIGLNINDTSLPIDQSGFLQTVHLTMGTDRGFTFCYKFDDKLKHEDGQFLNNFLLRKREYVLIKDVHDFYTH